MTESAQQTRERLGALKQALLDLGATELELVAAGRPTTFLVSGFLPSADALARARTAVAAAGADVVDDLVTVASRWSGPAPSALDGDPGASPARLQVRKLLDLAAHHRADNDYEQAVQVALKAEADAAQSQEPLLLALARFAVGYFQLEGASFLQKPASPRERFEQVLAVLDAQPGADPILRRNAARALQAVLRRAAR